MRLDPFTSGRVVIDEARLTFGRRTFAPGDIKSARIESTEKSSFLGSIMGFCVFLGIAAVIMEFIVAQVFPWRTLIGVVTLGSVGLASLQDTWIERGDGFFSLYIDTGEVTGEIMVFATSDRGEMDKVSARLIEILPHLRPQVAKATAKTA